MSIADSVRSLSEESANALLRLGLPTKTLTVGLPGSGDSWVKRRFMESKRTERFDNEREDLIWIIPDLPGGEW